MIDAPAFVPPLTSVARPMGVMILPVTFVTHWEDYGDDTPTVHRDRIRSFVASALAGTLDDWSFTAVDGNGMSRDYTFDGVTVERSSGYHADAAELTSDSLDALLGITSAMRMANVGKPFADGTPSPMADVAPREVSARTDDYRMNYARKVIAKGMGYKGIKAWNAAGNPCDRDALLASGIKASKVDGYITDAALPSPGGIAQVDRIVRPGRQHTGTFCGHSHNN